MLNVGNIVVVRGTTLPGQLFAIEGDRGRVRFRTGAVRMIDLVNLVFVDAIWIGGDDAIEDDEPGCVAQVARVRSGRRARPFGA